MFRGTPVLAATLFIQCTVWTYSLYIAIYMFNFSWNTPVWGRRHIYLSNLSSVNWCYWANSFTSSKNTLRYKISEYKIWTKLRYFPVSTIFILDNYITEPNSDDLKEKKKIKVFSVSYFRHFLFWTIMLLHPNSDDLKEK